MKTAPLSPCQPYLLRAFYEWLIDNQLTPYLVVDVTVSGVVVPMEYARQGRIILNIAQSAVANLVLSNEKVQFNARFNGILQHIILPIAAVLAIYSHENGVCKTFESEVAYNNAQQIIHGNSNKDDKKIVDPLMPSDNLHNIHYQCELPIAPIRNKPILKIVK
ncbi:ClpXP protease specificity-enhancing factor [Candidatus Curculioniphilus buchneri]|uniref:ClpXP protease specificity-enhancing factor n=1 Tax=Candidatus Curculioniphilus buchneri TaxID=690594 RepID=UPI00376F32D9